MNKLIKFQGLQNFMNLAPGVLHIFCLHFYVKIPKSEKGS